MVYKHHCQQMDKYCFIRVLDLGTLKKNYIEKPFNAPYRIAVTKNTLQVAEISLYFF